MRKRRKRYKVKLRFYLFIAAVLLIVIGGIVSFFGTHKVTPYDQGEAIVTAARSYITNKDLVYDGSYFNGGYPPDNVGVCTDVIWKGLRGANIEIKQLVDADIAFRTSAYSEVIENIDPNIDFRRVDVLEVYMNGNCEVRDNRTKNLLDWMPGDLVTFEHEHIAVVSDLRNIWGRPYILQHGKDPAGEEDRLIAVDGMKISGHFRWPLKKQGK